MRYTLSCLLILLLLCFDAPAQSPIEYLGIDHGLSNDFVTDIYQDKDGFMWFGTFNGLNRFDGYEFKVFKNNPLENKSLPDNRITDILEDQSGNLYVATKGGLGLLDMDRNHFTRVHLVRGDSELQPIDFSIHQLERDNQGQLLPLLEKRVYWRSAKLKRISQHILSLYIFQEKYLIKLIVSIRSVELSMED